MQPLRLDSPDSPPARESRSPTWGPAEACAWARELGLSLRYDCDLSRLAPSVRDRFVQLGPDQSLADYFQRARRQRHGRLVTWLHRSLRGIFSDFDINGLLGTYPMHVLGREQWAHLLPDAKGRLLDVGAGNGDVTDALAPLFDEATVAETSRPMARRLRRRGYRCHNLDLAVHPIPDGPFDAIALLNVLDRCDRPLSLLGNLRSALRSDGRLIVALVLPYRPVVYDGGLAREPTERLPIFETTWEEATHQLVEHVLAPLGFEVESCSRVPYLSGGDAYRALYELDDVVLVCRARGDVLLVG